MLLRYAPARDAVRHVTCRRCHRCLFCVPLCAVCTLVLCHTLSYALRSVSGIGGKMLSCWEVLSCSSRIRVSWSSELPDFPLCGLPQLEQPLIEKSLYDNVVMVLVIQFGVSAEYGNPFATERTICSAATPGILLMRLSASHSLGERAPLRHYRCLPLKKI